MTLFMEDEEEPRRGSSTPAPYFVVVGADPSNDDVWFFARRRDERTPVGWTDIRKADEFTHIEGAEAFKSEVEKAREGKYVVVVVEVGNKANTLRDQLEEASIAVNDVYDEIESFPATAFGGPSGQAKALRDTRGIRSILREAYDQMRR